MTVRTRLTRLVLVALAAAVAMGASACRPDFAPYNRLTSLRIMAVRSEPAAPLTGETATWSALVYTLPDDPAPTYQWSWCPFMGAANAGYACTLPDGTPVDQAMLASLSAAAGLSAPPLDLGQNATAQLQNFVDPTVLLAFCTGRVKGIPPFDCSGGFPFQIKVQVTTGGAHPDTVVAVAKGHWRLDASTSDNINPPIESLTANQGGAVVPLTDDGVLILPRDRATPIHAIVPMTAAEMYVGADDNGQLVMLTERLFITWFVESGGTDDSRTSYYADRTPFEDLQKNTWTPALKKDYAPDTARIFVVLHDNRGGVSWQQGLVSLVEPTP